MTARASGGRYKSAMRKPPPKKRTVVKSVPQQEDFGPLVDAIERMTSTLLEAMRQQTAQVVGALDRLIALMDMDADEDGEIRAVLHEEGKAPVRADDPSDGDPT